MASQDPAIFTQSGSPLNTVSAPSFVSGPTTPKLWNKTMSDLIEEQATRYENNSAAVFPWQGARLSYRDLSTRSKILARALLSCGLQRGDRVAIMAGNCVEYVEAFLAAAHIGCPYVVLNNTYSPQELLNAVSLTSCKMLFIAINIGAKSLSDHVNCLQSTDERLSSLQRIVLLSKDQKPVAPTRSIYTYSELLSRAEMTHESTLRRAQGQVQPTDILNLQFTSGTTGSPKAAMLTHNNLLNNGRFVGAKMHLTPKDIIACPPPLFHCFGLVMGFLASVAHGSTIVFPSPHFEADQVLESIRQDRCTALLGVPTMFIAILEANKKKGYKIDTVRTGLAAGSSVPAVLMKQLRQEFGVEDMLIAYGMTETSPVTFLTSLDDSEDQKTRTVGRVMPHTLAKVIDHAGKVVPRGTAGELCTSGFALQRGYWNNQSKTDEVMKRDENGVMWMHTGDECVIDQAGYCTVTGMIKDIIIRGGENVFPLEIEERLLRHPAISEASVVAIKDARYTEVVGAFMKCAPGMSRPSSCDAVLWVREVLGSHKSPKYCFWVGDAGVGDDLPKTGSGKYQKHILRAIGDKLVANGHPAVDLRSKL